MRPSKTTVMVRVDGLPLEPDDEENGAPLAKGVLLMPNMYSLLEVVELVDQAIATMSTVRLYTQDYGVLDIPVTQASKILVYDYTAMRGGKSWE